MKKFTGFFPQREKAATKSIISMQQNKANKQGKLTLRNTRRNNQTELDRTNYTFIYFYCLDFDNRGINPKASLFRHLTFFPSNGQVYSTSCGFHLETWMVSNRKSRTSTLQYSITKLCSYLETSATVNSLSSSHPIHIPSNNLDLFVWWLEKVPNIFSQMVVTNGDLPWYKVNNYLKHIQDKGLLLQLLFFLFGRGLRIHKKPPFPGKKGRE